MSAIRTAVLIVLVFAQAAHAQANPDSIPEPPTEALSRLRPFLGAYVVSGQYLGRDWAGTLDLRPAVHGWYVETEINVHSGPIDRQLRMMITWDPAAERYRIWRFETMPASPKDRAEGMGWFEGNQFVMEWREPAPDGAPGRFRNRFRMVGRDSLEIISEGERDNGAGGVIRIGVTAARRRM